MDTAYVMSVLQSDNMAPNDDRKIEKLLIVPEEGLEPDSVQTLYAEA